MNTFKVVVIQSIYNSSWIGCDIYASGVDSHCQCHIMVINTKSRLRIFTAFLSKLDRLQPPSSSSCLMCPHHFLELPGCLTQETKRKEYNTQNLNRSYYLLFECVVVELLLTNN